MSLEQLLATNIPGEVLHRIRQDDTDKLERCAHDVVRGKHHALTQLLTMEIATIQRAVVKVMGVRTIKYATLPAYLVAVAKNDYQAQNCYVCDIFNDHYINIVELSTGIAPTSITNLNTNSDEQLFNIINKFKNHPSIIKIKQIQDPYNVDKFVFKNVDEPEIKNLLSQMDVNVSTGEDKIPPKLVKLAKKYLVKPLTKAINISINSSVFPKMAKNKADNIVEVNIDNQKVSSQTSVGKPP